MVRLSISTLTVLVALSVGASACGKDKGKPAAEESDVLACESNSDCEAGWACLDSECANTAAGAAYTDPATAVTADKVKGELDKIQENKQKRADEILDGL